MIPIEHVLLLSLLQVCLGLVGLLLRRSAMAAVIAAIVALNGVLLAMGVQGTSEDYGGSQASGVVVLMLMVVLVAAGAAVLYSFDRFRRTINMEEHDRMKH